MGVGGLWLGQGRGVGGKSELVQNRSPPAWHPKEGDGLQQDPLKLAPQPLVLLPHAMAGPALSVSPQMRWVTRAQTPLPAPWLEAPHIQLPRRAQQVGATWSLSLFAGRKGKRSFPMGRCCPRLA